MNKREPLYQTSATDSEQTVSIDSSSITIAPILVDCVIQLTGVQSDAKGGL